MRNTLSRLLAAMVLSVLAIGILPASAQRLVTLETKHYRLMHEKKHAALAGEILEIAEKVWPTLAKAYESYEHFERIDILIIDQSDDANGFAIYPWSQVAIFAPHMDWVLRNRQVWLRNVVTHELAHVFSLRRAARLAPFDYVILNGSTYSARAGINFNFSVPWVPLIAPNWWIEGIAQFEAEQNGNDTYDSQRDMLLRDAWLTGTLPTLDFIETFDRAEDWTQGERVYNTGYAFLRYLKDRYGVDKVRKLAFHKPLFNFSSSAQEAFGQSLPDLFEAFKKSLAERYESFKDLPVDPLADSQMPGTFQQNLIFSSDGKYQAWLGNDDTRRAPMNWIYWKPLAKGGDVKKSDAPATPTAPSAPPAAPPAPAPEPTGEPQPGPQPEGLVAAPGPQAPFLGRMGGFRAPNPTLEIGMRNVAQVKGPGRGPLSQARVVKRAHQEADRSEELGSEGLEFNRENNRLLTSRQDWEYSAYTDIWEYEFRADKSEGDKWHRLTWEERASYPSYHPTERKILFVRKKAGSTNLAVLDSAGRIAQLTNFSQGQQVYNPRFTSKGDSIYFTLQVEDKEAIAAIPADVPAFDPFLALKDSTAAFPDSLNLARDRKLTMVTPLRVGAIRNLRFHGDTLLWSSNMEDTARPVYNVFVRLPGDPQVMRATQVRTQALEPLLHEGTLYYQGFQRQRFLTFMRPLVLTPTGVTLATTVDSVSLAKPKKVDFAKAFETGEYGSPRIAHEIVPYLSLQPQFLEGERSYTDLAVGMQLHVGDPLGNWSQSFSADVSKRLDWKTPLNYQFTYSGFLSGPAIRHTRITWPLNLIYSIRHDIVQVEDVDTARFQQGPATIDIKASYSTMFTRDFANFYFPLPYEFHLDGGFFRQLVSQNLTQVAVINDGSTGEITTQRIDNLRIFDKAQQHRHFQTGVNWSHTWAMLGTYRPTYANVWTSARKWWATYMTDVISADSALIRAMSQEGRPAPEAIFTQSQFDPWNLDAGLNLAWSHKQALTLFAAAQGGAFLNKLPTETVAGDLTGPDATKQEPFGTLWVLNYQLGYYLMPGYPYNFRYRGRDIMEGTSLGLFTAGFDIPVRGLGAFIPGLPISSFREFSLRGWANAGTTLIVPFDKIPSFVGDKRHDLLVDLNVRAAANFRIYHQYPFTIYAQGSMPYNKLDADKLFWYDYAHTGAPNGDGSPSAAQFANASADRKRHMDLVKVPRYYVGFTLGY